MISPIFVTGSKLFYLLTIPLCFFVGQDYDILIDLCNTELEKLKKWSESNRLSINTEKKNCLPVTNWQISQSQNNIFLEGKLIYFVQQYTFLGDILDIKLQFYKHIEMIRNKISKSIWILCFKIKNSTKVMSENFILHLHISLPFVQFTDLGWYLPCPFKFFGNFTETSSPNYN